MSNTLKQQNIFPGRDTLELFAGGAQPGSAERDDGSPSAFEVALISKGWKRVKTLVVEGRPETRRSAGDLSVRPEARRYLETSFREGIFQHQFDAIARAAAGENVCLTTGTASGKSAAFYASAIHRLAGEPAERIFAIYPLRALAAEQAERWQHAIELSGLEMSVGRLDGSVSMDEGWGVLRDCNVVILTPDIIHARVLHQVGRPEVLEALQNLSLVIVDEVHSYTGVFGSNAAYLFRRLRHLLKLLGVEAQFVAASATIRNPLEHLAKLVGLPFSEVGPERDTSRRHETKINLLQRPKHRNLLAELAEFHHLLLRQSNRKFITFVESRKQTENLAAIINRGPVGEDESDEERLLGAEADVLPYRSGYEECDRGAIQGRLAAGALRGVISTSALELGIDVPHLDTAVLVGVPYSSTSLKQRIGRVGRQTPGEVWVINGGSVHDDAVFRAPDTILSRPPAEGALYLENRRIQYIHALCLARFGGEHDTLRHEVTGAEEADFKSEIDWPAGFLELCSDERIGEIPSDLQTMKAEANDEPNRAFPLRDVETQFRVETIGFGVNQGFDLSSKGSLSFSQVLREAYPGAVYRYMTEPYRVLQVLTKTRTVVVRAERQYFTSPIQLPTLVFPNLSEGNVFRAVRRGSTLLVECNLQVRQTVSGFSERRGRNEKSCSYPLDPKLGYRFRLPYFNRTFFTTGVLIVDPALNSPGVQLESLATGFFDAFLGEIPFERSDMNVAPDKFRVGRGSVEKGHRFIALYDQTYGSLHLSSRLLDGDTYPTTLRRLIAGIETSEIPSSRPEALAMLTTLLESAEMAPNDDDSFRIDGGVPLEADKIAVIAPGSFGINIRRGNARFDVDAVFFNPQLGGLAYRGHTEDVRPGNGIEIWPVISIEPIIGESQMAIYDTSTGEMKLEVEAPASPNKNDGQPGIKVYPGAAN